MKIALATCQQLPHLDTDDQLLLQALLSLGLNAEPVIWNNPSVNWGDYRLCVIRNTWDYVPNLEHYLDWIGSTAQQTTLWNPPEVIRWNTQKVYLRDLEAKGIPVVPTQWVEANTVVDWSEVLSRPGWETIVVKPVVSAAGLDVHQVNRQNLEALIPELNRLAQTRDLMIQPFMESIKTDGEWSFLFIGGELSHAVAKVPAAEEFRIHEHLGGKYRAFEASADHIAFAKHILNQAPGETLYGRVDVMLDAAGNLCLSELEVTEPSMYLAYDAEAPLRFARAIQAKATVLSPV